MCEYTGNVKDLQRHSQIELDEKDINGMTKSLLNESLEACSKTGLNPFCTLIEPPLISIKIFFKSIITSSKYSLISCVILGQLFLLEEKLQDKPVKKSRTKTKAPKKPSKKTTNISELFDLDDNDDDESE